MFFESLRFERRERWVCWAMVKSAKSPMTDEESINLVATAKGLGLTE